MKNDDNFVDLMNYDDESIKLIDQSKHIQFNVNNTFGQFPEKCLNNSNGKIPFLLNSSHMNYFKHHDSVSFLTYSDMNPFYSNNVWFNDKIVMCFCDR